MRNVLTGFSKLALVFVIAGQLTACASYRQRPLNTRSTLLDRIPDLTIDPRQMPLPELAAHTFNPADGLDIIEVAMLAVVNNPDLKMARAAAGIAHAQAFAAGLLPDPQVGLAVDVPAGGLPAPVAAYSLGVGYDVIALLTRGPLRDAARGEADRTDLNLLWQEWQVVSQARQLVVRLHEDGQLMAVLNEYHAMFADRYRRTQTALDRGLLTLDTVTPHLAAEQDVERQICIRVGKVPTDVPDRSSRPRCSVATPWLSDRRHERPTLPRVCYMSMEDAVAGAGAECDRLRTPRRLGGSVERVAEQLFLKNVRSQCQPKPSGRRPPTCIEASSRPSTVTISTRRPGS